MAQVTASLVLRLQGSWQGTLCSHPTKCEIWWSVGHKAFPALHQGGEGGKWAVLDPRVPAQDTGPRVQRVRLWSQCPSRCKVPLRGTLTPVLMSPLLYRNKKPTSPEQSLGACGAGQGPRSLPGAKGQCEAVSEAIEGPQGVLRSPSSFSRPLAPSLEVWSYLEELSFGLAAGEENNRRWDV